MVKTAFACLLLGATSLAAQQDNGFNMVKEFVADLKAVAPKGWKVTINQLNDGVERGRDDIHIEVWRQEKVLFYYTPPESKEHEELMKKLGILDIEKTLCFRFYLTEYLAPEQYAHIKLMNGLIDKELREIANSLADIRCPDFRAGTCTKPENYAPANEEERKRVQALANYKKDNPKQAIIPNAYHQKLSFYFDDPREWGLLKSEKVGAECSQVLKQIETVFSYYGAK